MRWGTDRLTRTDRREMVVLGVLWLVCVEIVGAVIVSALGEPGGRVALSRLVDVVAWAGPAMVAGLIGLDGLKGLLGAQRSH